MTKNSGEEHENHDLLFYLQENKFYCIWFFFGYIFNCDVYITLTLLAIFLAEQNNREAHLKGQHLSKAKPEKSMNKAAT